ncbi:Uncharacterized protein BM_BM17197 [Brugia malayi]|uniref:Uncharacterized protein n=1 Tax=Brugia malayi TaxID=6279 RepID=A0A4E9FSN9_BRUMA|nr:Uncharacterized protein BM_BM17197 [Brugia malayi]VIP00295.1 Uncharacterized protein BM_BM17197 [Brugia malayi]
MSIRESMGYLMISINGIMCRIAAPMEDQEIEVLFEYLKREPEMYRILQRRGRVGTLPENGYDEAENWPSEAEWTPLPEEDEEGEEPEVPGVPMKIEEPVEAVRKLVLIPVPAMQEAMAASPPEKLEPADLKDLPEQLPRELIVPQAEPYTGHKEKETRTSALQLAMLKYRWNAAAAAAILW